MITNAKNFATGIIFIGISIFFGVVGAQYPLGTAFRMGPGFFPVALSLLLALLGIIVLVSGFTTRGTSFGTIPWLGMTLVLGAPVIFGTTVRTIGIVPAVAIVVFLGTTATRSVSVLNGLITSAVISAFCYLIFVRALGLQLSAFGTLLKF